MRAVTCLISCLLCCTIVAAQPADKKLEARIRPLLENFPGDAGIYVKNLRSGKTVNIAADTVFPTASMIKIPILLGIMKKLEKGELYYHQQLVYKDSLLYEGEDLLGSFKSGEKIELSKLLLLMASMSDNTASLWLQSLAGGGIRINQLLDSLGFVSTRMNSRTTGREAFRNIYGWGQTSPKEMSALLERIYRDALVNDTLKDRMLRTLSRNYWDEEALSQIPPEIQTFSKNGAVDASRSETVLVMAPHGPYLFTVMTKNLSDTTWQSNNPGWILARKLSRLLWEYFEPGYQWSPVMEVTGNPRTDRHD
ncbi:serine hydrolase [Flavihumibacter petaseus]|uniref:beta-lactamase n=1 Tax=Flavihumibacter petaseus NBRC 106054 TaxID=1220578 RepID=A0A0E9MXD4_9BACT|nr:serine hydrolase [Flavihumibacter petaseus]GAO42274.1 peptidase S11 family protein [Flavihumibacter petaseus NBRC 106054]